MTKPDLFLFSDFRAYIISTLNSDDFGRGGKSKLASHLNCQPSFISQVLKGVNTLSLEQAFKINSFFNHTEIEQSYFMTLVESEKAATNDLKNYYKKKLNDLSEQAKLIQNRIKYDEISESDTLTYYNNWNHVKIHHLANIPKYKNINSLRKKINISDHEFESCLDFLLEKKLLVKTADNEIELGFKKLHIKKESPLVNFAHIKARLENINNLKNSTSESLNFGANLTISNKNYTLFRNKLVQLLEELYKLVEEEAPERMCSVVIDLMDS
jgi:uncharacterized protein (TIGR02147 family)